MAITCYDATYVQKDIERGDYLGERLHFILNEAQIGHFDFLCLIKRHYPDAEIVAQQPIWRD